jgi:hypothetical protein
MAKKQFHKGDPVRFQYGMRKVQGVVKEDRGPIGVKGRNLYLVVFKAEPPSPSEIELPADQLEFVSDTVSF